MGTAPRLRFGFGDGGIGSRRVLVSCAPQQQAGTPAPMAAAYQNPAQGTLTFSSGAVAPGVGFKWGSSTLKLRGGQHPFRVLGLSVRDIGATRADAEVAGGGAVRTLRNHNGIIIGGLSIQQGLRLTLAASRLGITLTGQ